MKQTLEIIQKLEGRYTKNIAETYGIGEIAVHNIKKNLK
jgi:hypothetical protein